MYGNVIIARLLKSYWETLFINKLLNFLFSIEYLDGDIYLDNQPSFEILKKSNLNLFVFGVMILAGIKNKCLDQIIQLPSIEKVFLWQSGVKTQYVQEVQKETNWYILWSENDTQ